MIDISEARAYVLERCHAAAPVAVPCRESTGLVLASPVVAAEDVPPFANSAVDGYAVVAASVATATDESPVELPVVAEVAAGAFTDRVLQSGEAIRIMTGAPVPAGADAIVMVEDTERIDDGKRVAIRRSTSAGAAVRPQGDDVRVGTTLYAAGTLVSPAVAGVLASVNAAMVQVVPRVRVAVLSTGDELVDDGSPLQPGQIRESNRTMLLGLVRAAGCDAVDFGVVRDDEAELEHVLRHKAAIECDAIVTSGGVSMGDYDVVKAVLSRIADMRWMQIAIRPAKPFAFGLLAGGRSQGPGVRPARQSGQLDRQLRAARPPGVAADDGPHHHRSPAGSGHRRRWLAAAPRWQDALHARLRRVRRRRPRARANRSGRRAAISWPRPRWRTRSRWSPMAMVWCRAARCRRCCCR